MKKMYIYLSLFLLFSVQVFAQKAQVSQVSDQLFLIQGYGGNIAFLVTDNGVVLVDAGMTKPQAEDVLRIISEKTDKPLKYIILTHYHWDHTNALPYYPTSALVVSHKNLYFDFKDISEKGLKNKVEIEFPKKIEDHKSLIKKFTEEKKKLESSKEDSLLTADTKTLEDLKMYRYRYPDLVYDESMTIFLGKDTIDLVHPGNGHTDGDTWVIFKNKNVIQMGDWYFENRFPFIDLASHCDLENWSKKLKEVSSKGYTTYIPGHGAVSDQKGLVRLSEYLSDLRSEVAGCIQKGKTLEQTIKELKFEKYKDFEFQQFKNQNIEAVYKELKGSKK